MTKFLQEKQKNLLPDKFFADRAKNLVNYQFLAEKAKLWSHDKNFTEKVKIKKPHGQGLILEKTEKPCRNDFFTRMARIRSQLNKKPKKLPSLYKRKKLNDGLQIVLVNNAKKINLLVPQK